MSTKKRWAHTGLAGCVSKSRARATGTLVGIYNAEQADMCTEGGPWVTVCEPHGQILSHENLRMARMYAPHPGWWCWDCQKAESGLGHSLDALRAAGGEL